MTKTVVNNRELEVQFQHGRVNAPYGHNGVVEERETDYTRVNIFAGSPGTKRNEKELIADVTIRRHHQDPSNRVIARVTALRRAIEDSKLGKEERIALWGMIRKPRTIK